MKEEQLKLFDVPQIKIKKRYWPFMFHLIIIEQDNEEYHIWQGGFSLAQAKKLAARKYNKTKKFYEGGFVEFSETYEKKVVR